MRREFKVAAVSGAVILGLLATGPAQSLEASNTVFSDDIVDGEVKAVDIGTGAVQAAEIAANSVTGTRIVDGSIGNFDLGTNSVGSAKVINNSLTGTDINESSLDLRKAHFAVVNTDGTKLSGDASSSVRTAQGAYEVTFPFTVSNCAATASPGYMPGSTGYALVIPMINYGGADKFQLLMYKYNASEFTDTSFRMVVVCP